MDDPAPRPGPRPQPFLALLPTVARAARLRARHARCPGRRDDLAAEAVALA